MKIFKKKIILIITCLSFAAFIVLTLFASTTCFDCTPNISKRSLSELTIKLLAQRVSLFNLIKLRLPDSLEEIARCTREDNTPCNIIALENLNSRDAWNKPIAYKKLSHSTFSLTSLGADGVQGGTGLNADITIIQ